jgi:hypothetical protein
MVNAVPNVASKIESVKKNEVLASEPQYLVTNEQDDASLAEFLTELFFEDVGGQELINISRHDLVDGQRVVYTPIKNLSSIRSQYNSANILSLQGSSDVTFKNFAIRVEDYLVDEGTGPNGEAIYMDSNGDIIINFINISDSQQVEIQLLRRGSVLDDTIYGEEL